MFIVDVVFLLRLLHDEQNRECLSMLTSRIKQLSIQTTNENDFSEALMDEVANAFVHVRHLIIESKGSESVTAETLLLWLSRSFRSHRLVSVIVRSTTTEQLRANPVQWLTAHTLLHERTDTFLAECDDIDFKLWS